MQHFFFISQISDIHTQIIIMIQTIIKCSSIFCQKSKDSSSNTFQSFLFFIIYIYDINTLLIKNQFNHQIFIQMQGHQQINFIFENYRSHGSSTLSINTCELQEPRFFQTLFRHFSEINQINQKLTFQIYDPFQDIFVPVTQQTTAAYNLKNIPNIKVRYQSQSKQFISEEPSKNDKNKQRTIREVIDCVKRWREIHGKSDQFNNKVTLQQAARQIGISKKSLDDYYCQLRLGQLYQFDFKMHLDQKMRVLRAHIKKFRPRKIKNGKNEKYPKHLKIIEQSFEKKIEEQEIKMNPTEEIQKECQQKFYESMNLHGNFEDPFIPFDQINFRQPMEFDDLSYLHF